MEALRLLKELDALIMAQKTVLGVTRNFHQEDFLELTNKIRAAIAEPSSPERIMDKTANILARHLRQEEVAVVIGEIRSTLSA